MKVLAVSATVMEPTSEVAAQAEDIILYVVKIKNTQTCILFIIKKIIILCMYRHNYYDLKLIQGSI